MNNRTNTRLHVATANQQRRFFDGYTVLSLSLQFVGVLLTLNVLTKMFVDSIMGHNTTQTLIVPLVLASLSFWIVVGRIREHGYYVYRALTVRDCELLAVIALVIVVACWIIRLFTW